MGAKIEKNKSKTTKIVEEVLNSSIHGIGAIAGVIGLIFGIVNFSGGTGLKIGFVVYGISLIVLMTMSSLYHALSFTSAKSLFRKLDHSSIFVLIAGSYTPFVVYLYSGWQLALMLSLVWAIAIFGIVIKTTIPHKTKKLGNVLYIGFGWMALLLIPRFSSLGLSIALLLLIGGIFYTIGAGIMAIKKPFTHVGWHAMVVVAATAHYAAIIKLV
jgi:hemolysin III